MNLFYFNKQYIWCECIGEKSVNHIFLFFEFYQVCAKKKHFFLRFNEFVL